MQMKALVIPVLAALVGCAHSGSQQLPPTVHSLTMNVTSSNPTASKWFAFKETLTAGASICDPPTSTNYQQLNQIGQASSTYVDLSSAGTKVCEFMQYQDASTPPATSPASNIVGPFSIPANPTAPIVNSTQASAEKQPIAPPSEPLVAKLTKGEKPTVVAFVQ